MRTTKLLVFLFMFSLLSILPVVCADDWAVHNTWVFNTDPIVTPPPTVTPAPIANETVTPTVQPTTTVTVAPTPPPTTTPYPTAPPTEPPVNTVDPALNDLTFVLLIVIALVIGCVFAVVVWIRRSRP